MTSTKLSMENGIYLKESVDLLDGGKEILCLTPYIAHFVSKATQNQLPGTLSIAKCYRISLPLAGGVTYTSLPCQMMEPLVCDPEPSG